MGELRLSGGRLTVRWDFFLLVLAVLLLGAEQVFLAMVPGVLFHELGHVLLLWINGGRVEQAVLTSGGVTIIPAGGAGGMVRTLGEILAGPLFSFAFALLTAAFFPMGAGFSVLFGLYNLLPCRGLDGGRAVQTVLERCLPEGEKVCTGISAAVTGMLVTVGIVRGSVLLLSAGLWTIRPVGYIIRRKTSGRRYI